MKMTLLGIAILSLMGIAVISVTAQAACNISNNSGDDYAIICTTSPTPFAGTRGRRVNIQTFSTVRTRTTVIQNTGLNNIIAGEDNENPIIVTGNATSSIDQIIRVGNVRLNFYFNGAPVFPE